MLKKMLSLWLMRNGDGETRNYAGDVTPRPAAGWCSSHAEQVLDSRDVLSPVALVEDRLRDYGVSLVADSPRDRNRPNRAS